MPKRKPALRPQQPAQSSRKKAKQRAMKPVAPPPIAFPTRPVAVAEEEAPPPALQDVSARRPAPGSRLPGRDYAYVKRELQRIAMTATLIVVLLIVLSFVIR